MKTKMILIGSVVLLAALLAGCIGDAPQMIPEPGVSVGVAPYIDVVPICEDEMVCYKYDGGYSGGLSCLRDADLVDKYCGTHYAIHIGGK
jgi:hypothetical protein